MIFDLRFLIVDFERAAFVAGKLSLENQNQKSKMQTSEFHA